MATKEQVLKLLEKGLNPQQIAKKLGCNSGYVRAVRAREFGNGLEVQRRHYQRNKSEINKRTAAYIKRRYHDDPEFRARVNAKNIRGYYRRKAEQSQSAN